MRHPLAFALALALFSLPVQWFTAGKAMARELHVFTAGAVQEGEKKLADGYRHMTGNRVTFIAGTVGQIEQRLKSHAAADVIVVSKPAWNSWRKPATSAPTLPRCWAASASELG